MEKLNPPRGCKDWLPEEYVKYKRIENIFEEWAKRFGFRGLQTPIFEHTALFYSLGESSDIVTKETYTFADRKGQSLTLRPEGTAGVVRAIISNGLTQDIPLRLSYQGPMFRYERPQKGRYRQFHQIGVEAFDYKPHSLMDGEVIAMAVEILKELGLRSIFTLQLNSLGDGDTRKRYRQALVDYLTPYAADLSYDSQMRLQRNPLRILDSKELKDQEILSDAPVMTDYLTPESRAHFEGVKEVLTGLNIDYRLNPRLVRGLDYYTHTVFEITTEALGAQGALVSGGRYDGLVATLGGPSLCGVGWAAGVERLLALLPEQSDIQEPTIVIIPFDPGQNLFALQQAMQLRAAGHPVVLFSPQSPGKGLKKAVHMKAQYAILIGEREQQQLTCGVKNLLTGIQEIISVEKLSHFFEGLLLKRTEGI